MFLSREINIKLCQNYIHTYIYSPFKLKISDCFSQVSIHYVIDLCTTDGEILKEIVISQIKIKKIFDAERS